LALRLIDEGARLVADDQVELTLTGNRVVARAPERLRGLIEARGVGILRLDAVPDSPLLLVADLAAPDTIERMPEPATTQLLGVDLPCLRINPFAASATAKLRFAARVAAGSIGSILRER
jgi:serine kinase of HPr protein (carbohydrate metabolism regulator)